MSRNVNTAAKYLKKEIDRLSKERDTWELKESIAHQNKINCATRIQALEAQIEELEPKTSEE